ncbi:hypothetical protein D3C72_1809780 [compost metagenome]
MAKRGVCSRNSPLPGTAGYRPIALNRYHADIVPRSSLPVTPLGALVNSCCAARTTVAVFHGWPISVYIQGACRSGSLLGL